MNLNMLKDKLTKLNSEGGIPFMEGRTKTDLPTDSVVGVDNFGFIHGEDGDYVVISLEEYPDFFFFGGGVVTEKFKDFQKVLDENDVVLANQKESIPMLFTKKKNKSGKREYMTCEFYPEV